MKMFVTVDGRVCCHERLDVALTKTNDYFHYASNMQAVN